MRIRAKAQLCLVASGCVVAVAFAACTVSFRQLQHVHRTVDAIQNIEKRAFDLQTLSADYLLRANERAHHQWLAAYDSLTNLIGALEPVTDDDREMLRQTRDAHREMYRVFQRLVALSRPNTAETAPAPRLQQELRQRLGGQLSIKAQIVVARVAVVHDRVLTRQEALRRFERTVVLACIAILGLALIGGATWITRSVVRPVLQLQQGTAVIAQGNLHHKVGTDSADEIGALARAFDDMMAVLLATTASRNDLNEEVAERRRAQAALTKLSEELKQSNMDLEQFAYAASHDLQEPLRKIAAFGDRLKTRAEPVLDERCREYLARMLNASDRMRTLITDLLTFSRLAARARPFETVDLNKAVRDVLSDLEVSIGENDVEVQVETLPKLQADPTQIRQLLQNLISNAVKFRRPDVTPVVSIYPRERTQQQTETATTAPDASARWAVFVVEDNGIGIDPKYSERIFGVFQRLHSRDDYAGTGVGLAVCRRITDRHGGRITVEGRPGQGTAFVIELPLTQPTAPRQPANAEARTEQA